MKKKGFTLIELLAVIMILAIISLIVGVTIGNVVDKARKQSFKETVYGIIRSSENHIGKYALENNKLPEFPVEFICDGTVCTDGTYNLEFDGEVPLSGSIYVKDNKTFEAVYLNNGSYCALGDKTNLQVSKSCSDLDITKPIVTGELDGRYLKLRLIDNESGIDSYCVTTNPNECSWISIDQDYVEHGLDSSATYYAYAKDKKGNISDPFEIYAEIGSNVTYVFKGTNYYAAVLTGEDMTQITPDGFTFDVNGGTFLGWTDEENGDVAKTGIIADGNDKTLYAVWTFIPLSGGGLQSGNYISSGTYRINSNVHSNQDRSYGSYAHSKSGGYSHAGARVQFYTQGGGRLTVTGYMNYPSLGGGYSVYCYDTSWVGLYGGTTAPTDLNISGYTECYVQLTQGEEGDTHWIEGSLSNIIVKN